jgi:Domain of unknown function (DUF1707)/Domain of unknown function (DUF4190)
MTLDPQGIPLPGYGQMRSATVDKERAVDVLKAGFAEGRLTKDEYEERVGLVYASHTYGELAAVTADLPAGPLGGMSQQPQAYPAPPPYYPVAPAQQPTSGLAIASFVCSLFPGIPAIVAIALGFSARAQIRERGGRGLALANAGIAIGGFLTLLAIIYGITRL